MNIIPAETILLADVLHNSPNGALWSISSDSWKEILNILMPIGLAAKKNDWVIEVNENSRDKIESDVLNYNLGAKIVHMQIISKEGKLLFSAFDRMSMITIKNSFESANEFASRFPEIEIFLQENG